MTRLFTRSAVGVHVAQSRIEWVYTRDGRVVNGGSAPIEGRSTKNVLGHVFCEIKRATANKYAPVGVALADPYFGFHVLDVEGWPRRREEQERFARFVLRKEVGSDCSDHRIGFMLESAKGRDKPALVIQSLQEVWVHSLKQKAAKTGIILAGLDSVHNIRLKRFRRSTNWGSTALLAVDNDYWSLSLHGTDGLPRYLASHWHISNGSDGDTGYPILSEVRRLLLAATLDLAWEPKQITLISQSPTVDEREWEESLRGGLGAAVESLNDHATRGDGVADNARAAMWAAQHRWQ